MILLFGMKKTITYLDLVNDVNIIEAYRLIDELDYKPLALHGMCHVVKTANIVETLLTQLGASARYIDLAKIAALLHDLGMRQGKHNHAKRSVKEAKKILKDSSISVFDKYKIFRAIKNHSNANFQKDLMGAALVFADKLDCDKFRLGSMGYDADGLRQSQFINKVDFVIEGNMLTVLFETSKQFDHAEFADFYHAKKIFGSVKTFAKFVGLKYNIYLNKTLWINELHENLLS